MSRFFGNIGYGVTEEIRPGYWDEVMMARPYFGDVIRMTSKNQNGSNANDDIVIGNQFSVVADPFAYVNFSNMKYIEFMGTAWKITSIETRFPRLIITTGGVWNGEKAETTNNA